MAKTKIKPNQIGIKKLKLKKEDIIIINCPHIEDAKYFANILVSEGYHNLVMHLTPDMGIYKISKSQAKSLLKKIIKKEEMIEGIDNIVNDINEKEKKYRGLQLNETINRKK